MGLTVTVTSHLSPLRSQASFEPLVMGSVPIGATERMTSSPILGKLKLRN